MENEEKPTYRIPWPEQVSMAVIRQSPVGRIKQFLREAEIHGIEVHYLEIEEYYHMGGDLDALMERLILLRETGSTVTFTRVLGVMRQDGLPLDQAMEQVLSLNAEEESMSRQPVREGNNRKESPEEFSRAAKAYLMFPIGLCFYGLYGLMTGGLHFGNLGSGFTYSGEGGFRLSWFLIVFAVALFLLLLLDALKDKRRSVPIVVFSFFVSGIVFLSVPVFLYFMFVYYVP